MMTTFLDEIRANLHPFETAAAAHLFVADGSRIYDLERETVNLLNRMIASDPSSPAKLTAGAPAAPAAPATDDDLRALLDVLLPPQGSRRIGPAPIAPPPVQSLSLNVAQACNMSCGYCYAGKGTFGGEARMMSLDTAKASVDRLLNDSAAGSDVVLGFMGGEPLLARGLVHDIAHYADAGARARRQRIRFSITTNGTLLTPEDVQMFALLPFTVTISLDGPPATHRRLRMLNDHGDAYARLVANLDLFGKYGRPRHLSARMTVTPLTGDLAHALEHVMALGFDTAGFSPVLVSPDPVLAFTEAQLASLLDQMKVCGRRGLAHLREGRTYPFSNFETALHELHRGTHRPYPCGAGAGYLSVDAEGGIYACHRLIADPEFAMGDVRHGLDQESRAAHLRHRHVDGIDPCRRCWARYLCGGGCYHEVSRRGRIACDYIRGWLHFCLQAYVELLETRPQYFERETHHG
jgi:uncharacterized protein